MFFPAASLFGERGLLTKDLGDWVNFSLVSGVPLGTIFLIPSQLQNCPWARRRSAVRTVDSPQPGVWAQGLSSVCPSCGLRTAWFYPISSTENFPSVTGRLDTLL